MYKRQAHQSGDALIHHLGKAGHSLRFIALLVHGDDFQLLAVDTAIGIDLLSLIHILTGDYLAILTLGFGEIIRITLNNIDDVLGFKLFYGSKGLKNIPKYSNFTNVFLCVVKLEYLGMFFRPLEP